MPETYESLERRCRAARVRVAELEAALNDIKQMTSKAASFTRYAYAVHEFDGPNHWHDLSEINALCGPKEGKQ
jgi:carbonic anhydrase